MLMWSVTWALLGTLVAGQGTEHRRRRMHAEMYADLYGDGDGSPSPTAHVMVTRHAFTDEEAIAGSQPMEPASHASASDSNASSSGRTQALPASSTNASFSRQTQAPPAQSTIDFDYGICVGCVVAIVLSQASTHAPTRCWSLPPLQQSVLRPVWFEQATLLDRMHADIAEQLQQVDVPPDLSVSLIDGLQRWVAAVSVEDSA